MSRSLGIPVKLLHEASGHVVTVELKSGELYRGSMIECEDNWNCQLESITYTAKSYFFEVPFSVDKCRLGHVCWEGIIVGLGMDGLYHLCMQASMRPTEATFSLDLLCYMPVRGMEKHRNLSTCLFEEAKSGQRFDRLRICRFMVIPDMLKNAPMFKRLDARIKGKGASLGVGRGRAVAMRAKAQAAGRGAAPGRGVPPVRR
ncbi:hypothetical protein V8G54_002309 [Vigna mungo]|uniref:Small nuclear ribonucleoprotein Sm D3 n=1 Tax=Vigna mungo TaxID=3915 RepID=A0AAQ3PAB7_VIGMU